MGTPPCPNRMCTHVFQRECLGTFESMDFFGGEVHSKSGKVETRFFLDKKLTDPQQQKSQKTTS